MPFIKISGLTTATAVSATNQFEINQNGGSRSATVAQVAAFARTSATDPVVLPAGTVSAPGLTFTGDTNTGIYSPAADTIAFTEGGVEAMRIDASGNVGIGTTTPTAPLDVNGNVAISGTARRITGDFSNATFANRTLLQSSTGTFSDIGVVGPAAGQSASWTAYFGNDPTNTSRMRMLATSVDGRLDSATTGTGTALPMTFYTGGAERMRITAAGNVGINTASPASPLEVSSTSQFSGIALTGTGRAWGVGSNSTAVVNVNYQHDAMAFTASGSERMRIDASGNVGIGTSSPFTKLHLLTPSATSVALRAGNSVSFAEFQVDASGNSQLIAPGGVQIFNTNGAERMRIDSAGNVGIGTSSPAKRFVVSDAGAVGMEWSPTDYAGNMRQFAYNRSTNQYVALRTEASQHEFYIGGTERMRIDASGNVGIGTASPGAKLDVVGGIWSHPGGSVGALAEITADATSGANGISISASFASGGFGPIRLLTSATERMRITAGGDLLVGSTSSGGRLSVLGGTSGSSLSSVYVTKPNGVSNGIVVNSGTTSTDPAVLVQTNNGTTAYWLHNGDIYLPGGTAGVKTVSDKRLKRDVTYLTDPSVAGYKGLETVMALKPVTFRFKTDDDAAPLRRGWIADDFAEQMPELVTETKIPGGDEVAYKSVADGGLIPVLVSALKELKAENDALKARVAILENK